MTNYAPLAGDAGISVASTVWATARNALTGTLDAAGPISVFARLVTPDYAISRYFVTFDTSAFPADATIVSAIVYLYGQAKGGTQTDRAYNIYNSSHSDTVVAGDYDLGGSTPQCDTSITQDNWSVGVYNSFELNAAGKASVVKAGYTKFCLREVNKDVANSAPAVSNNTYIQVLASDGASDAYLTIIYTQGLSGVKKFMTVPSANIKKIMSVPVGSIKKLAGVS
jgi:hypothetical protein